jgi:tyrosyl-tRNA synthetase
VFSVERDAKFGGSTHYNTFAEIQEDFKNKQLHPKDLKTSVANGIIRLLEPIRKAFEESEDWQRIEKLAYPDPNAKVDKKKKKEKIYHPPPPGKSKNTKTVTDKPTPEAPAPEIAHAETEAAKQQPKPNAS